jgi:hypothetical protein
VLDYSDDSPPVGYSTWDEFDAANGIRADEGG